MIPPSNAFRQALKVTASGAATVLLSTVTSCAFAVVIESSANRLQYKLFPHWYDNVKYATGLPHLQYQQPLTSMGSESNEVTAANMKGEPEVFSLIEKEEVQLASDNSQTRFQNYQDKLQEKAQFLSPERATAMYA